MPYECRICHEEFDGDAVEHLLTKHPNHPIAKEITRIVKLWCQTKDVSKTEHHI